ncbi:MAG: metallopeptidase TldD-related protein [Planctomycetota bacterium]
MSLLHPDEASRIGARVLDASRADETEVTINSEVDRFARYADVGPTQSADRERVEVSIRVRFRGDDGWREARASAGATSEREVLAALARATELAGKSPANPDALPLGGPVEVRAHELDEATLAHGFDAKARWIGDAVAQAKSAGLEPSGLARTTALARSIQSSSGRDVYGLHQRAAFSLTATGPSGSGFGEVISKDAALLDPAAATERAVGKARGAQDPIGVDPGEWTVVLEPNAVSSILLFASYHGFGAREVSEESSFLCGRIGEQVFAPGLTIADDAGNDVYPGLPFDGEGTPREAVTLVDRGRLTGPVTDAVYAKKLGLPCTGHAARQPSGEGPSAINLVVGAGDRSVDELIAGVDRGLLVTQFHYTNMIEPRDLTLTGMTRNGTFLIEGGELKGAVKNLRFTETLVGAMSRVAAVGAEREVAGALFDGEIVSPGLRIDGFRFTSTTDF